MKEYSNLVFEAIAVCTRFLKEGISLPEGHASPCTYSFALAMQQSPPLEVTFYCTALD